MKKQDALKHWEALPEGQNPLPHMEVIRYKSSGSRFGACGIRIDGNPEFIDAVLSNLKTLIGGENNTTRLELAYNEVKPTTINGDVKHYENQARDAHVCYIRLHERGGEAKHLNKVFNVYDND